MALSLPSSFLRRRVPRASDVAVAPGRPPSRGRRIQDVVGWGLRVLIRAYQLTIAGIIPASCRYEPSCSHYAAEAILRHGPLSGVRLAVCRIARCHPWGGSGYDPVPDRARRYAPTGRQTT